MYYLRDRKGKSARISEKIKKKIGINVSESIIENEITQKTEATKNKPKIELDKEESKKENLIKDKGITSKAKLKKEQLTKEKK